MNFLAAFFGAFFVGRKQRQRWEEEMNALYADIERREDIAFNAGFHEGYDAGYDDAFAAMRDMDQAMRDANDTNDQDDEYDEYEDEEDATDSANASAPAPLTEVPAWQPLFNERISQRRQTIHGSARKRRTKANKNHVPGPWGGTEPRKDSIDG